MNMGTKKNQINFIEELKIKKAKYILTGGTYQSIGMMRGRENFEPELTPEQRFPYINNFILNNYNLYESINKWKILILK